MVNNANKLRTNRLIWPTGIFAVFFAAAATCSPAAIPISNDWISPRNEERAVRRETRYIILHTTEAASPSALRKLQRNGEAHYLLDERGRIFRIVDRRRVAYHCGRSMWDGRTNLDLISIGIEVTGYHNRTLSNDSLRALAWLLKELQRIYRVPDERVLPHSMVAYGTPNRWHPKRHRGRKRCGMQFAREEVRAQLGLQRRPLFDPDVRAGRLVNADDYLAGVLFGSSAFPHSTETNHARIAEGRTAWDIARERYNRADTCYVFPDGTEKRGDEIHNWRALPPGTRVVLGEEKEWENEEAMPRILGRDGRTPRTVAGEEWNRPTTLYVCGDGRLIRGHELTESAARKLPAGTRVWIGFSVGEPVTVRRRAFDICGLRWKAPDTFYVYPDGTVSTGDRVEERRIPVGTRIFFREAIR